ncbi:flavin-nucleotide-binding protein [Intrasporangium oryzae NRRL B-24470]|uniref:Flavin-nucleotide-binding protein n=1 Tax=Intrasporangium oryzae NRRL B-24470 TaxID=1386089 RepID=W9GCW5_9MICO|nr:pyridoxamine 5'-phosphate oxidase family protein [Intrasporangium oryzae]EWT02668.1 flavin-nucleotide-binding protein [Intrasporangium oryzae NRRL B-24470]
MDRTRMTRLADRASTDVDALNALLDAVPIAHVGLVADGGPVVIPTALARDGDRLLVHGSTGSGWMRRLAEGAEACVTVTALDAVVVARSAFESSYRYRSAVLFGRFVPVEGAAKEAALDVLVDHLLPGRRPEVRPSNRRELSATLVLAMPIGEWSLKVAGGWPEDPDDDVAGPAWAGIVPVGTAYGTPEPAPDLRPGIPVPASVRALASTPGPVTDPASPTP